MSKRSRKARRRARLPASQSFEPDYSHNIKDLKRIGALAGLFIGLMIVLSFFLN